MAKCRRCRIKEGTLYYDGQHNKTKTPVCQECLEELVSGRTGTGGFRPGYVGPSRDPDHNHLAKEHVDAQDWWDSQIQD